MGSADCVKGGLIRVGGNRISSRKTVGGYHLFIFCLGWVLGGCGLIGFGGGVDWGLEKSTWVLDFGRDRVWFGLGLGMTILDEIVGMCFDG